MVHVLEAQGVLQAYHEQPCRPPGTEQPPAQQAGDAAAGCSSTVQLVPAAAVYVKVFARDGDGDEFFYK